jgi:hypothetical protein
MIGHVSRFVTNLGQARRECWRKLDIDQETHGLRGYQDAVVDRPRGVAQRGGDILG